ncbi:MAG TPA: hypothetical protein VGS79_24245 [Puia sp.]|nr:hypothetical protein [Puia sp.]
MNNSSNKSGCEPDLRSMLKNQHKKVYSICRFFAHNYQEHQRLFTNIIAAASQNIRSRKDNSNDKQTMLLRACINMAALHSISLELESGHDATIQFKSPDYQRSMSSFRESVRGISDLEKFRLFLELENVPPGEVPTFTGLANIPPSRERREAPAPAKNFIPYLKAKLIWS